MVSCLFFFFVTLKFGDARYLTAYFCSIEEMMTGLYLQFFFFTYMACMKESFILKKAGIVQQFLYLCLCPFVANLPSREYAFMSRT